jgi:hypothetical protein
MKLEEMSVEQLKALAYDLIGDFELTQKKLRMVNDVIASKLPKASAAQKEVELGLDSSEPVLNSAESV